MAAVSNLKKGYHKSWEIDYFVVEHDNKLLCLVCGKYICHTFSNVCRHYNLKHKQTYENHNLAERNAIIKSLKMIYHVETVEIAEEFSDTKHLLASYTVALKIAQSKKYLADGEFIKNCAIEMAKALGHEDVAKDFESVALSRRTVSRRIDDISEYVNSKLYSLIANCSYFSLCLDESTDKTDISQLVIFIRTIQNDFTIHEEMLDLIPLHGTAKGIDVFRNLRDCLANYGEDFSKCSAIVTDGARAMTGKDIGLWGQLRKHGVEAITLQCIIHQEALCGKIIQLSNPMKVVKEITNLIRGGHSALTHRIFRVYLKEIDAQYPDLPLYCEVRWLSAGRCLNVFFALRKEILIFLQEGITKDTAKYEENLSNESFLEELAFLTDITYHLNLLNLNLQKKNQDISQLFGHVRGFKNKLNLFKLEIKNSELHHFQTCSILKNEYPHLTFMSMIEVINILINEFNTRFSDFNKLESDIILFNDPLIVQISNQKIQYRMEMCDLQADPTINKKQARGAEFFKLLDESKYPSLKNFGLRMASMFGSTYICESTFSIMNSIKTKQRARLNDLSLTQLLRVGTTKIKIDLEELIQK